MNEQLLKDFIATAQKYNYNWNTVFGKFPELKGYDQQLLKDYVATAEKNNYDYDVVNSKFPELGFKQEPLKKKESTDLVSKSGKPTLDSSSKEGKQPIKPKPVTKKVGGADIVKGYPSDPSKEYKFENGVWYETKYTPSAQKPTRDISASGAVIQKGGAPTLDIQSEYVQIKSPSRVAELNRYFKKQGSTSTEFQTFTGLPGNENREYRVSDGNWIRKDKGTDNWVTITDEKNISYLNSQFKQDVKPFKSKAEVDKAKDYNNLEKQFQNNLSYINSKLVDQSEESVVPKLQQLFPAFKFEQSQAGADRVMVTAPNGKQEEFLLDNYTFSQDKQQADMLRGWLNSNYDPKVAKEQSEIRGVEKMTEDKVNRTVLPGGGSVTTVTPSFVDRGIAFPIIEEQAKKERADYYRAKSEQVKDIYNKYSDYVNKTGKVDDLEARAALAELKADDAEIKRLNAYQDDIKLDIQDYATKKKEAAVYLNNADAKLRNGEITQEQYDLQYKPQIEKMEADLKNQQSRIKVQTDNSDLVKKSAERAAAENFLIQESKGSFGGGLAYSSVKALTSLPRLALGIMGIDGKDLAEDTARELGLYTTKEYMESEKRADLAKAAFSLTESLVAMGTGGSAAGSLALYGMGYYEMKDELDQVEGMTEQQKMIMAGAYGLVSAALERFGLEAAVGKIDSATGKSLKMGIMKNVFSSLPKDAPKEVIENAIMNETKKYLTSAGLDVAGGMIAEGTTEALQSLSAAGMKELYDVAKETNYFNKEGAGKVFEDALYEGYLGALGGGIMSTVYNAGQAGVRGMRANSNELKLLMKAAETEGMDSAVLASVKADMLSGKINKEQAKAIVQNFQEVKSKVDQMPSDINEEGKAIALNLMTERDELNKQIAGKDPNLVKPQTDRINEINNSLQQIPIDYAVQEQSTGEVPVQSETGVSGKVEEGISEAKPEGVTGETITEEVKVEEPKGEQPQAEVTQEEVDELQTVRDRILKIEEAKSKGELLEDSQPGELKSLKERESELVQKVEKPILEKQNQFNEAGLQSKEKNDGKILGQWILDNSKLGDTITDEDGNGYEVTNIDKQGNVELTSFEINDNGDKDYNQTSNGIRIVSKTMLNQGDLFEYSYTNTKGDRVTNQYKYNAKPIIAQAQVTEQPVVQEVVQAEVQKLPEAQPDQRFEFTPETLPEQLKDVEPEMGVTEVRKRLFGKKEKVQLVFSGQQMIDAGLAVAPGTKQEIDETIQERPIVSEQGRETGRSTEGQVATGVQPTNKREGVKKSLEQLRDSGLLVSAQKGQNAMTNEEIDALMSLSDAMASVWAETTGNDNFYETFIDEVKAGDIEAIKEKGGILFQNVEIPQAPISRVSLAVFNLPEFKKMQGTTVALQNIKDMIKSRGKDIEKDIINRVLDFDKYQGVKRVDFDEFKNDVDLQVMKLEKIETTTYADYGMDNLGNYETYGVAETIVYNSPVDHGQKGHFSGDFISNKLKPRNWEVRELPGTNQYIAIDADVPAGLVGEQLMPYVGTAGNKQSVEKWIENRNRSSQNSELNVGLFGHIRGWYHESRNRYYLAEAQSDYFQKNKASDLYRTIIDKTKLQDLMSSRTLEQNKKIIKQFEEETGYRTQVDFFPDMTRFSIYKDADLIYQFEDDNMSMYIINEKDAQENALNFLLPAMRRIYNAQSSFSTDLSRNEGIELGKKIWIAENNKTQFPVESELEEELINANRERRKWKEVQENARNNRTYQEAEDNITELTNKSKSLQREIENIPSDSDLLDLANQSFRLKADRIDDEMNDFAQELSRDVNKLEEKLIDEAKNSKEGDLILKQFIASQKVHEIRLFREAVKHAAEIGATELWFPSPYTLAIIEGYVSGSGNIAPYDITSSRYNDELNPGDNIDYEGDEYVVIDSDRDSFKAAPRDYVNVYDINDYIDSEVDYFVYDALKSDFNSQFGDGVERKSVTNKIGYYKENETYSYAVERALRDYAKQNPDQDIILWDDIEEAVADDVRSDLYQQDPSDLFSGDVYFDGRDTYYVVDNSNWIQEFKQPDQYDANDSAENFESRLNSTQQTVVNKYKDFNKYIQKSRPDAEFVVDDNGRTWLKTNITQDDLINPIIAFQNEGGRIKGAIDFQNDNKASVYIFDGADISTLAHEITGHLGRRVLEKLSEQDENFAKDYQAAMDWAGVFNGEWSVAADEKFARGFEKYLRDGKAPTAALKNVFEKLRSWLINIYRKIKGSSIDIELTPEITAVFDNLLRPQKEAKVEQLRGFDRMMSELDGIIEKSRKRRVSEEKVLDNAMNYLQGSAVYERATDVQREQMVRDLRKKFGKREKSAPSVKKLFGEVKDVKKITMPEYDLMVKQLMDFEKGAKTTLAKVTKASKELTAYVKEMVKKGHITTNQAVSVLRRFSATNLLDENSVSNFVNYMRKVFNDAEYANKIANIRKKLPTAKKNIKTKIGIAKDLAPLMERVFAINPSIIPDEVFNKYSDAVMMMGERAAVLNLDEYNEIKENLIDVIDAVEMEAGLAEELVELFNDNKVVEEGKLNFSETLNKMFDEGLINEYERSLMKKYKSLFTEKQAKESKKAEKVEEAKKAVASATINSAELPTKDERDVAKKLAKLVNAKAYEMLTDNEIIQLSKVINNINNGFLTHKAEQLRERMSGLVKAKDLISPIQQVKVMFGELLKGNLKSKVTGENVYTNIIKGNSAAFIDEVFGNFKERPFFNNIYEPIAQAIQRFNDENKIIRDKVDKLENDLLRHFKNNGREATKSKFKMMTYMLQVENDSNPDSKQVNPAQAFIEKTIQKIENGTTSMYTDRDAKELQSISDEYGNVVGKDDKGNDIIEIDSDKLYKSFSAEEKRILKGLRDINDSMTEKAEFTASVIRGNRINPINNYISLSTISDDTGNDQFSSIVDIRKMFDSTRQASTKAKSLIERTGKVSAINFDPFSSVRKSSSAVLMDYNMTPTIRESRIALKQLENDVKEGVLDKSKRDFVNALRDSFDLIVDNAIGNNMLQGTLEDSVIAELAKQGYRTMLASIDRAAGELLSNTMFVTFVAPVTWAKGTAYSKFLMSSDFFNLLNNVGSTQTSRIKPGNTLSNRMIDTSILQQATGLKGSSVKSEVRNRAEQIYNLTGKKVKNVAELTADTLISTPDKIMMQPLWMGTFASEFKKETGVDVDVNKLAANDEAYMDKYADAIEKARREADDITVRAGSTDNGALAVLRNTITPEQKASRFWKWYKTFNGFMSKFLLFEYMTARSAIYQLFKEGRISKKEAVAELAAVTARMTMYSVVISMLGESVIDMAAGLLGYRDDEDDEEEKKKTLAQEVGQGLASTFTTMMFGRNFGNVARAPINMGVEYLNQNYLDFLRNGEYDPYTDQLQYTIAPKEGSKDPLMDIAMNTIGPISPFYKTGRFIGKYMYAPEGKTEDKKERQRKEKWRIALEVPGSLGFVPFYNNIRKVQQDWIYGDLKKAEKITYENIGSKIQSAKSTMSSEISKAVKESASGTITSDEMNARISEAQMLYLEKIQDYMKRLR